VTEDHEQSSKSAQARQRAYASFFLAFAAACGSSFQAVKPTIDASLLLPCVDPLLAPVDASDNELAAERLRVAKAYLDCKARHGVLADRVK